MKTLLSISFLFFLSVSCKTERKKILGRFPDGKPSVVILYPDKSDTTTGSIFVYYHDGKIKIKLSLDEDKYVGQKITYYHSGQIEQIDSLSQPCDTSQDECDGSLIRYYENGKISQRYTVRNNIFNGMSQHFLPNGVLAKEYELKNGMTKNGIYKEFSDNGNVSLECTYQNDTIVGFEYFFNEKGDTIKYLNHYNGQASFPYKKWLDNGLILYGNYTDTTAKAVKWIWFDKKGNEIKSKVAKEKKEGFVTPG